MTPHWLTQALIRTGDHDDPRRATRAARAHHCHQCGAPIVAGLDADAAATVATADLTPLNTQQELAALLTARRTYNVFNDGGNIVLELRTQFETRNGIPQTRTVIPSHKCGHILAPYLTTNPASPSDVLNPDNDEVPF